MTFLNSQKLYFPASVLHGQEQLANGAAASLHVLVPAAQSAENDVVGASGSTQVVAPMPGQLQLPGLWLEVSCLEVKVGTRAEGYALRRAGGWAELQHLEGHYVLALSVVSGRRLVPHQQQ
jgi:hypothetical protein